jgi:hypothetical protein
MIYLTNVVDRQNKYNLRSRNSLKLDGMLYNWATEKYKNLTHPEIC